MLTTDTQQMQQYQDRMNPWSQQGKAIQEQELIKQGGPQQTAQILTDWRHQNPQQNGIGGLLGLGGLAGNSNLQDRLKFLKDFQQGGQYPFTQGPPRGLYEPRPKQYDVAGGFEEFGETLGGYKETLGGYGEQLGGFGETLGGYGEQISGFEEQLGGFGEQFSGIQEQVGGVGEDINEINERLGGIEEGISTLSISKPEQKQNPYSNMFNPFSFIGNWGGSRSRMSYR